MTQIKTYQGWSLHERNPNKLQQFIPLWEWLYRYYFRVQTSGWQHIPPQGNILFVSTHNGGLASPDLTMFMVDWLRHFGSERPIYGLMHPKVWQVNPGLAKLATQLGAIQAHPKMATAALRQGASVLVYPGGAQDVFRPYKLRQKIHFVGRKGFIKLAIREGVPIVPLVSWGAHDTLLVLDDCYQQAQWLNQQGLLPWPWNIDPEVFPIYLGLPWGIGLGPIPNWPLPVQIQTRVCTPIVFERYGREAVKDLAYVDECYDKVVYYMQAALDELAMAT